MLLAAGIAGRIETRYRLDGPESISGENYIFRAGPNGPSGPPTLLYEWPRVFPVGKAAGAWFHPILAPRLRMVWNYVYTPGLPSVVA
jgi:hypothetical protein